MIVNLMHWRAPRRREPAQCGRHVCILYCVEAAFGESNQPSKRFIRKDTDCFMANPQGEGRARFLFGRDLKARPDKPRRRELKQDGIPVALYVIPSGK
jgi:hypothetical protein